MRLEGRPDRRARGEASDRRLVRWLLGGLWALLILLVVVLMLRLRESAPAVPTEGERPVHTDPVGAEADVPLTSEPTVTPPPSPEPTHTTTAMPSPAPTLAPTETPVPTPTLTIAPPDPADVTGPLAGRVEQGTYESGITGRTESYRVYLPPGYDESDQRYPTLYLFHGWPYDETHWADLGIERSADAGIREGILSPFIIVLPRANSNGLFVNSSGGPNSFEAQFVNELVPHIDLVYRTIQARDARAIGGISRGGVWSLQIGFTHPDMFGVVGAHSSALAVNRAPPVHDPLVLVGEPGVEHLRIYLSAGDEDWALTATWQLHEALGERGIRCEYSVHPGAHVDALWAQHIPEYLTFYTADW